MYESIITLVCLPDEDKEQELEIRNIGNVLEFYLNHKKVFGGDWSGNFQEIFKRALKLWESET